MRFEHGPISPKMDESDAEAVARMLLRSDVQAAGSIHRLGMVKSSDGAVELATLDEALIKQVADAGKGTSHPETERYMKLALKAQSQCTATLAT